MNVGPSFVAETFASRVAERGQISRNPRDAPLMERLSEIGISVWLHDLGAPFAGPTERNELCFHMVKISRSFVPSCETQRRAKLLVNSIHWVGSCAERTIEVGVEKAEQIELVASFGADLFQGYHLGRPTPEQVLDPRRANHPAVA